jgi:hypothetical protein
MIGLALAAISAGQISPAAAQSSTPTYVLGVSSPLDPLVVDLQSHTSSLTILSGASGLSLLGPGSVLFIDGAWLQSASSLDPTILSVVDTTVLNGVPSVVMRGNPAILQNSISGLLKLSAPNLPLIAAGLKVFNTLQDGTRQAAELQVIQGFDYAVNTEFTWAQQQLSSTPALLVSPALTTNGKTSTSLGGILPSATTSATSPSWQFVVQVGVNTGDYFSPMARIISTFTVFNLTNTGSNSFKWYNFFANQTLIPGIFIYNSPWRNLSENDIVNVDPNTNTIVSHGPTSLVTSGPTVVTYSIGVSAGTLGSLVTANQTQSYPLKNTNITATTQSASQVGWVHNINPRTDSGKLIFQIIPGCTDRVQAGQGLNLQGSFTSTFATLSGGMITQTASANVQFGITITK